jgi:hypothetical protein
MDEIKSSVVSIVPVEIHVNAEGAYYPGIYHIPKADDLLPKVIHVGEGWHRVYLGVERGWRRFPITSSEIAKAIVNDYIRSSICTGEGCEPGIFSIPNKTIENAEKECKEQLVVARSKQLRWYEMLIRMADNDWSKSGHRHNVISDLQRFIAKKLKLDKEWLFEAKIEEGSVKCPACFSAISKDAIVCFNCRLVLKPEEYTKLKFATV